jgi:hypothetical protein
MNNPVQDTENVNTRYWQGWYWLVIGALAVQIALYAWCTAHFKT